VKKSEDLKQITDRKSKDLSQMSLSELEEYRADILKKEEEDALLDTTTMTIIDPIR
jgi:hypothetical protein